MAIIECSSQYLSLKKQISQLDLPPTLQVNLHDPFHTLILDQQQLSLNFNAPEWQQILTTKHPLLKAVGTPTTILDACAGLGKDGFILANAGFEVTSTEENLLLYALLSQAVEHLETKLKWNVLHQKAQTLFSKPYFDVIYLDPMFMTSKKSKPKKNMQFIQSIASPTLFEDWESAYHATKKRLVIKHDHKLSPLTCLPKPSFSVSNAKKSRFDIYIKP
jgi:16S rRNA (guanine1516-N2)-methyltransferase